MATDTKKTAASGKAGVTRADVAIEQDEELRRIAGQVADVIGEEFAAWVDHLPGLESQNAQIVLFTLVLKRLRAFGIGPNPLVQQVLRAYGLNVISVNVEDPQGNRLQTDQILHPERMETGTSITGSGGRLVVVAPGSQRKDN